MKCKQGNEYHMPHDTKKKLLYYRISGLRLLRVKPMCRTTYRKVFTARAHFVDRNSLLISKVYRRFY